MATVEFGILKLEIPSILVLGHTGCGAVMSKHNSEQASTSNLQSLLDKIVDSKSKDLDSHIAENVKNSIKSLKTSALVSKRLEEGKLTISGGVYDISTGKVNFIK